MVSKKKNNSFKNTMRNIWHFLWYDDSWLSWFANLILAFILIKFIIYPLLGLFLGTQYPIVAVVSDSMKHSENFDSWWEHNSKLYEQYNITKEDFLDYRFKNGFSKGDIMILMGVSKEKIKKGDVLVFKTLKPDPIIHRIVEIKGDPLIYHTKGDNNPGSIQTAYLDETNILPNQAIGVAVLKLPLFGWLKIGFVTLATCPMQPDPGLCMKQGFAP